MDDVELVAHYRQLAAERGLPLAQVAADLEISDRHAAAVLRAEAAKDVPPAGGQVRGRRPAGKLEA